MHYYGFDMSYFIFVLPAVIFSLFAQFYVNFTVKRYSKIMCSAGYTGYDAAKSILSANGLYGVRIEHISGNLTDHYDPKSNTVRLSDGVYNSASVTAVGIAAHEAGHAVQYATGYFPIKIRSAIVPVTNISSNLALPLVLLGILFSFPVLSYVGCAFFGVAVIFQLVTLPVEFNASAKAIKILSSSGVLDQSELVGAKKTLRAAALTYVAALAAALGNFLRLISISKSGNRR